MKNRKIFSLGIGLCLMLTMAISANAADYTFNGVDGADYYRSTDYESVYGSAYNYGGKNVVDFAIPDLPYGVVSNTSIGAMERVRVLDSNGYVSATLLTGGGYGLPSENNGGGSVHIAGIGEVYDPPAAVEIPSPAVITVNETDYPLVYQKAAFTGAYLAEASFRINKADGSSLTTVETDENGEVLLTAMDPGVYQITEVTPPVGYLPAEQPSQLITLYPNKLGTAIFENHAKPSITINKIDSITKDPIKSVSFHIVYSSNQTFTGEINDLGKFSTDANGQIKLEMVKDGWYRVTELEPAKGYAIKGSATQDCYIEGGKPESLTFENTPLSAIVIKKTSNDGKSLQGAWFRLRYLGGSTSGTGGTTIGEYETSANGTIVVTDLKAGTY